jgi:capsid portal protein
MMLAKEQFNTQYKGTGNAHKMLIGGWVKDIKTLSVTPRDMEFINQRKLTTEKISAVFWVPKSILGYVDNVNYANAKELRKEYIEWTIIPYQNDFENILNTVASKFLPLIYENYWIRCDWEQVDETEIIYENQRKDIALWVISINEARLDRWLEVSKDENADKLMINRNMVLLEDITLDATLNPNEQ